jgi:glycosyltransferase involved in cell wall biosynthesis
MGHPKASVVIPAFNAQQTIVHVIQAVLAQTYPGDIEIIVVDDGSTDRTPDIVQSFREVRYIRQENAGPASARNKGASVAKGQFIFFTDSDCIAHRNWIERLFKGFIDDNIGVVCGSYGIANDQSMLARSIHREILYRHHFLMPRFPQAFGSYNFCVRRHVFSEAGGFNEDYRRASGEDNDLSYKILKSGYRIYFVKDALVDHYHPTSIRKYLKEQFRHGFWRAKMYWDHPGMVRGDDYTFWKDMVEVPLSVLCGLALVFSFFHGWFFKIFIYFILAPFLFLEVCFAFVILRAICASFYYGYVMLLRSFARTSGLSTGIPVFFYKKISKKESKKSE